jgi:tRNA (guanine37-N1)-methyltransferase
LSLASEVTLLCGHYKDVDQRVAEREGVEEVSVGDFVLSGGEFAALCVMDAVVRLLPGALGDHESAASDSHYDGLLSPPSYTRPPEYRGRTVPEVLLSGTTPDRRVATGTGRGADEGAASGPLVALRWGTRARAGPLTRVWK